MKASRTLLAIALSVLITAVAVVIVSNGIRPARAQGGPELTPYQVAQQVNLDPAAQEICFSLAVPAGSTLTIDHITAHVQPVSNTGALPAVLLITTKLSPFLQVQGPRIPLQIVGSIAVGSLAVMSHRGVGVATGSGTADYVGGLCLRRNGVAGGVSLKAVVTGYLEVVGEVSPP